jgi:hypothetical protein
MPRHRSHRRALPRAQPLPARVGGVNVRGCGSVKAWIVWVSGGIRADQRRIIGMKMVRSLIHLRNAVARNKQLLE